MLNLLPAWPVDLPLNSGEGVSVSGTLDFMCPVNRGDGCEDIKPRALPLRLGSSVYACWMCLPTASYEGDTQGVQKLVNVQC